MKHLILLILVIAADFGYTVAADLEDFAYRRTIETEISQEGLGSIELDRGIFSRTRDQFADLRLFEEVEGATIEIPFVIERVPDVRPGAAAVKIPSEVLSFVPMENGDIEIRVRLKDGEIEPALLELRTPLRNFEKNVSVSGVNANGEIKAIVSDKLLFDYESFLDFRRTTIVLPPNSYREFVVRISKATDKQRSVVRHLTRTISPNEGTTIRQSESVETRRFRIDELSFYSAQSLREESYSIRTERFEVGEVSEDVDEKTTQIRFRGERAPVDSLIVQTNDRNFKRQVEVQVPLSLEEDSWRTIHRGSIHRFTLGEIEEENLTLSFSEQRSDLFRLLIHNRDSPPIEIVELVGVGEIYEMRFIAQPGARYAVFFGASEIERGDYDIAAIKAANASEVDRIVFKMSEVEENLAFKPSVKEGPGLNQSWILWIAIAVAVVGLLLVLLKTAKHIDVNTD